jgi:DNA repair exonuclease SbcCD ATPase subunit
VQAHRESERAEADAEVTTLTERRGTFVVAAQQAKTALDAERRRHEGARKAWADYEKVRARRLHTEEALERAIAALGRPAEPAELESVRAEIVRRRHIAEECRALEVRLERRPGVERDLETEKTRMVEAAERRERLLEKVQALAFDNGAMELARAARREAKRRADTAARRAQELRLAAVQATTQADAAAQRLTDAEAQHAQVDDLALEARHLSRVADLLNSFRNSVVGRVGPRLSAQAAELFGELTDHEYDRLEVDAETYEIQIRDAGLLYGMDRFSGSESDLANLALRVAISEQVRFQSGGAVGLLVLDEVFGPLDDDRKERMLLALERLRARFRQVLVVTHDSAIKEQLPNAIEVVKLPGRRATARLL